MPACLLILGFVLETIAAEPTPYPPHPRLILSRVRIAEALREAERDPLQQRLHRRIVELSDEERTRPPVQRILVGPRLLEQSRLCLRRVVTSALAYHLTGDARHVEGARKEMLAAAAFADWNPDHFLDTAEMGLALALGYDWLHAEVAPADRTTIADALRRNLLCFAREAYGSGEPVDPRLRRFVLGRNNWNQVCNTGLLAAALALAGDDPALADTVVSGVRRSLPLAMAAYQPDGAYPEGPMYWGYGTSFNVLALSMLETACGTDFGLSHSAAFDRTARYRLHVHSPAGKSFNYGDGDDLAREAPEYTWLAQRFGPPEALEHSRALLADFLERAPGADETERLFALHALWFPGHRDPMPAQEPLDAHFRGPAQLAVFRGAWNDPNAVYVGVKAGRNDVNHAHLDLGSFVLDALGVRWVLDLGRDDYDLPGYLREKRWSYYRNQTRSHNTLTFGEAEQDPRGSAEIVQFHSKPERAVALVDLTAAYPGVAHRIHRSISLIDRERVLVEDEVEGLHAGTEVTWRIFTDAAVERVGPMELELRKEGRRLRMELLSPASGCFTVAPAHPSTPKENPNEGVSQLSVTVKGSRSIRYAVRFSPSREGGAPSPLHRGLPAKPGSPR